MLESQRSASANASEMVNEHDGRWDGAMGTDDGMAPKLFFPSLFEVCVHARSVESLSEGESLLEYVY